jgi:hypothetical protein
MAMRAFCFTGVTRTWSLQKDIASTSTPVGHNQEYIELSRKLPFIPFKGFTPQLKKYHLYMFSVMSMRVQCNCKIIRSWRFNEIIYSIFQQNKKLSMKFIIIWCKKCSVLHRVLKMGLQALRSIVLIQMSIKSQSKDVQKPASAEIWAMFVWSLQQMFCVVPMHCNTTLSSTSHRGALCREFLVSFVAVTPLSHWKALNTPKPSAVPTDRNPED